MSYPGSYLNYNKAVVSVELTNIEVFDGGKESYNRFSFYLNYKVYYKDGSIDNMRINVINPFSEHTLPEVIHHYDEPNYPYIALSDTMIQEIETTIVKRVKQKPIKITMSEIEKKFGRPVMIVKEDSCDLKNGNR